MSTINLPMPPSTNALTFNKAKGGRAKTDAYSAWREEAGWTLLIQRPPKLKGPVELEYLFEDGGTKADLGNLEKPVTDLLVTHRVIEGDGPAIVRRIMLRWAMGVKGCSVTVINLRPQVAA